MTCTTIVGKMKGQKTLCRGDSVGFAVSDDTQQTLALTKEHLLYSLQCCMRHVPTPLRTMICNNGTDF